MPGACATRGESLELVAGLASAEYEDPDGFDREHKVRIDDNSFVFVVEAKIPVAYLVWPAFGRPHRGYAFEGVLVGDPHGVALNHHAESPHLVGAGRHNDV